MAAKIAADAEARASRREAERKAKKAELQKQIHDNSQEDPVGAAAQWVAAVTNSEAPAAVLGGCSGGSGSNEAAYAALHEWLKSGERLCELVNTIRPNSVKKIARTTKPFQQMENIAAYLRAVASLGVPAFDAFMTVDLWEGGGMRAVVRNLHSLGRVAQNVDGFEGPHLGAKLATKVERQFTEAQLAEARGLPSRWTNRGNSVSAVVTIAKGGASKQAA